MPIYTYKARDAYGRLIHGRMEAKDEETLASRLKKLGCLVTRVRERSGGFTIEEVADFFRCVKEGELALTTLQLAKMVRAGIPLLEVLRTVVEQTEGEYFKNVMADVARNVEGGSPLSDALSRYPQIFDDGYVSIV
ncbi:MAG: type II secretion system F family protein, partial [Candidatus Omnitrophota bacterium]